MAFSVIAPAGTTKKKSYINKATRTPQEAFTASVAVVAVDVNGLQKLPNKFETQLTGANSIASSKQMEKLTGDTYYIYIAQDGVAKGPITSVSGRLVAGEK